jgi:hypothetical protein
MNGKACSKLIHTSPSWLAVCYLMFGLILPGAAMSEVGWEEPKADKTTKVTKSSETKGTQSSQPTCDVRRQDGKCWIACFPPVPFGGGRCFMELPENECNGLDQPANPNDPNAPGNIITTPASPATCRSWRTKAGSCQVFCESDRGVCFRTYRNNPETPNVPSDDGLCSRPEF